VTNRLSDSISVINNPNSAGVACNLAISGVNISPNFCAQGLPNHISSAHRQKAQINAAVSGTCGMVTFSYTPPPFLCAQASDTVSSIEWRFNDSGSATTNTSSASSPQHFYSQNGNYTVALLVRYSCYTDTLKQVVNVSDFPNLTVSGKQTICIGEKVNLTLGGASSYSLNGATSPASFTAQPSTNTDYTISATGTGTAACVTKKTVSLTVLACTNLTNINGQDNSIKIYPNPSTGIFTIESEINKEIIIIDVSGRLVYAKALSSGKHTIDLSEHAEGMYFLKTKNVNQTITFKLIKTP
jgi:hypothetical protein